MNFKFYLPTKVVFGSGCIAKNRNLLASLGRKALIVTGARSSKANGSLKDVIEALGSENRDYVIYDKALPNPTIDCV